MSFKPKKILDKCKELAKQIQKILEENRAVVDVDFKITINVVLSRIENEFQRSSLKHLTLLDGTHPFVALERALTQYVEFLTKIQKEGRLRRYMQSTRVRKNLDMLNNNVYAIARFIYRKLNEYSKEKRTSKQIKQKSNPSMSIEDSEGQKLWLENFGDEVLAIRFLTIFPICFFL
jgi:hypothetical protein